MSHPLFPARNPSAPAAEYVRDLSVALHIVDGDGVVHPLATNDVLVGLAALREFPIGAKLFRGRFELSHRAPSTDMARQTPWNATSHLHRLPNRVRARRAA